MSSYSQVPLHICKVNVDRPPRGWIRLLVLILHLVKSHCQRDGFNPTFCFVCQGGGGTISVCVCARAQMCDKLHAVLESSPLRDWVELWECQRKNVCNTETERMCNWK